MYRYCDPMIGPHVHMGPIKRHFGNERQRTKRQKIAKDKERRKTYKDNFNTAMKDEDSR